MIEEIGGVMIVQGDALESLRAFPNKSVHCCVTSPPYWGLRDYGLPPSIWGGDPKCAHEWGDELPGDNRGGSGTPTDKNGRGENYGRNAARGCWCQCGAWKGSLGLEPTPQLFVDHVVTIFREARRVLRDDGTLWLNLGDSYAANRSYQVNSTKGGPKHGPGQSAGGKGSEVPTGLKPKDLIGIPWRVAFALQADGWYLRQDIIWAKPNPMPESVRDRCTKAHEYLFLLAKSERYYFDAAAIAEPTITQDGIVRDRDTTKLNNVVGRTRMGGLTTNNYEARNKRDVWTVATAPYKEAHFATFPPKLIEPCILAGCPVGGVVLDPFGGAGTTGLVAQQHGRQAILLELNPDYAAMAAARIRGAINPAGKP